MFENIIKAKTEELISRLAESGYPDNPGDLSRSSIDKGFLAFLQGHFQWSSYYICNAVLNLSGRKDDILEIENKIAWNLSVSESELKDLAGKYARLKAHYLIRPVFTLKRFIFRESPVMQLRAIGLKLMFFAGYDENIKHLKKELSSYEGQTMKMSAFSSLLEEAFSTISASGFNSLSYFFGSPNIPIEAAFILADDLRKKHSADAIQKKMSAGEKYLDIDDLALLINPDGIEQEINNDDIRTSEIPEKSESAQPVQKEHTGGSDEELKDMQETIDDAIEKLSRLVTGASSEEEDDEEEDYFDIPMAQTGDPLKDELIQIVSGMIESKKVPEPEEEQEKQKTIGEEIIEGREEAAKENARGIIPENIDLIVNPDKASAESGSEPEDEMDIDTFESLQEMHEIAQGRGDSPDDREKFIGEEEFDEENLNSSEEQERQDK
ncbi:MAG: hypothetical protein ACOC4D_02815 [Bacteroidota bacterium]